MEFLLLGHAEPSVRMKGVAHLTRCPWGWERSYSLVVFGIFLGVQLWGAGVFAPQLVQFMRSPWRLVLGNWRISSSSEKTLTPFSVPQWHQVAYPCTFFGWVGEFRTPTPAAFVLCFHPLEKGSRVAKQGIGLVGGAGEAQGPMVSRASCRDVQVGQPRVTLKEAVLSWCVGSSSYCRIYLCACRRAGHGQKKRRNYLSQQLKDVLVTQLKKNWITRGEGNGKGW